MKKVFITMSLVLFSLIGYTQDAKDLYIKGVDLFEQNRYQDAIRVFSKAVEINPKFKEAYFKRGVCYSFLEDFKNAAKDFTKVVLLDPSDAKAYYNRGLAYKSLGFLNKALVDFGKAIELNEDFALAYFNRGLVKIALDDIENACPDLSRASDLGIGKAKKLWIYYCRGIGS